MIRVVLGEDSFLVRKGVERILSVDGDIEVVASCESFDDVLAAVDRFRPDAVVTDIRMPPTCTDEGIRLANELRASHPGTGVVVLSQHASALYAHALLADGAGGRAYMLKDRIVDGAALTGVIREVAAGGMHVDPAVVDAVVTRADHKTADPWKRLTPRETEVLALLAGGDTNALIAEKLSISKRAVERHVNAIFTKLELQDSEHVSRRVKAALLFLQPH